MISVSICARRKGEMSTRPRPCISRNSGVDQCRENCKGRENRLNIAFANLRSRR
ncbi:hypothetical protein J2Z75_001454 [Rhizobium herbae]|uniref:Uncharacterized protein n=1 Tax=Rhizobium herbae TaxID=508661 RepID=A0ABS4EJ41_9HYPH|nr:hypothetical protein [Rhizobium herbae]